MHKKELNIKVLFALILLLGVFLRWGAALHTMVDTPLRADAGQYYGYAYNLRHHGIYSRELSERVIQPNYVPQADALRPPGYPLFLLGFIGDLPTDGTILAISIMQAVLGALVIVLIFLIARVVLPGAWPLLPTLLTAISPQLINIEVYVLTEALFTFLLVLSIFFFSRYSQDPAGVASLGVGSFILGMATLTRPTTQYVLPFILMGVLPIIAARNRWRDAALMIVGFCLPLVPWLIRNVMVLGYASDPTLTISALVHGHYPDLMFNGDPATRGYPYRYDPRINEISTSVAAALRTIWDRMLESPSQYIWWYLVGKPALFLAWSDAAAVDGFFTYPIIHSPYLASKFFILTMVLMQYTHWIWIMLCVIYMVYFALQGRKIVEIKSNLVIRVLIAIFVYFVAVHMVAFPIARYSIPLLPIVFIGASLAVYLVASGIGKNKALPG